MSDATSSDPSAAALAAALADLREDDVMTIVRQRIAAGDDPLQIIEDCQEGMREVGNRYAREEYYLSGLILAGDVLAEIMALVMPLATAQACGETAGRVLVGTAQGDIHDLGKNLLLMLLRVYGFTVLDLGVDVAPGSFVETARIFKPDIIGLSGLITAAYTSMRETVAALRAMMEEDGVHIPILLGGQIDEQVSKFVGADYWSTDAMEGVRYCQQLMNGKTQAPE